MLSVYLFMLASALIIPIPEAGGVGAMLAFGVDRDVAVSTMVLNRALSVIAAMIFAALAIAILPGEFRAVMSARRQGRGQQRPAQEYQHKRATAGDRN